jgi:hypothetical protein
MREIVARNLPESNEPSEEAVSAGGGAPTSSSVSLESTSIEKNEILCEEVQQAVESRANTSNTEVEVQDSTVAGEPETFKISARNCLPFDIVGDL